MNGMMVEATAAVMPWPGVTAPYPGLEDGVPEMEPQNASAPELPSFRMERSAILDLDSALREEWLVTNGLGDYAAGTALGVETRCYQGLLVSGAGSPSAPMLLLARVHETIETGEDSYELHTCEYHDGTIHPPGYIFLQEFRLEKGLPVWRYRCRDVEIEKTLWMEHGMSAVFIRYRLLAADNPVWLRLEPFAAHREPLGHTRGHHGWRFDVEIDADVCRVEAFPGAVPLWLRLAGGRFTETGLWYWRFLHRHEAGYDRLEDLYTPVVGGIALAEGQSVTLVASARREEVEMDATASYAREVVRRAGSGDTGRLRWPPAIDGDRRV